MESDNIVKSGLVLNEKLIDPTAIKSAKIKIGRISKINSGVRIWFQIQTDKKVMFQRWSMLMNDTDEVLVLANEKDTLEITYVDNLVVDDMYETFEPFDRKFILTAKFA